MATVVVHGAIAVVGLWAAGVAGSAGVRAAALTAAIVAWNGLLARRARRTPEPAGLLWSHLAPVLLLAFAAGMAVDDGFDRLYDPRPLVGMEPTYGALGLAVVAVALLVFTAPQGMRAMDLAAPRLTLAAFVIALVVLVFGRGSGAADGAASLVIGLGLAGLAAATCLAARDRFASGVRPPT
jgi:hypothetical protein